MVSSQQLVRLCAGHKPMRMRAALETLNHAERQRGRASAHGGRAAVFQQHGCAGISEGGTKRWKYGMSRPFYLKRARCSPRADSDADGLLNAELTHLSLYVLAQPKAGAESGGSSSSAPSGGTSSSSADTSSSSGTPSGGAGGASSGTAAPAPGMPRTGDAFPLVWVTVAAAACVVLLAVLAWKKHRETRA